MTQSKGSRGYGPVQGTVALLQAVRLGTALLAFCGLAACVCAADPPRVDIEIFPERSLGPISPYVFGAGIDHKTNPMRFCQYPEQVAKDIADSKLRMARYPGGFVFNRNDHRGSWANFYWQDHIGKNPDGKPFDTGDLDTFLKMCERFGIEPLMQINFVGEPEESIRGFIEYLVGNGDIDGDGIDWSTKRVANGRKEPYRIRYWQLGNEVHDYPQGFHSNAQGAREYAEAIERLVPQIRKLVPDARIVVPFVNIERPLSGLGTPAQEGKPDINFATSGEFARAFLEHLQTPVDYFDWHTYPANGWDGSYPFLGTDDEWKHYYGWGTKFRECYEVVVELMKQGAKQDPLPRIIVGEWAGDITGMIFPTKGISHRGSMMRTMASGVYMADILLFLMEKSVPGEHIHAAMWHNFGNGTQEMFSMQVRPEYRTALASHIPWQGSPDDWGYWPTWPVAYPPLGMGYKVAGPDDPHSVRMPIYHVFRLLSEQRGDELVATRREAPGNRIEAPPNGLYWDPEFHFDRVTHVATRKGDFLYLAVLNKDANLTVDLGLDIQSWKLKSAVETHAVGSESYLAENSMADPNRVTLSGPNAMTFRNPAKARLPLSPNTLLVLRFQRAAQ